MSNGPDVLIIEVIYEKNKEKILKEKALAAYAKALKGMCFKCGKLVTNSITQISWK